MCVARSGILPSNLVVTTINGWIVLCVTFIKCVNFYYLGHCSVPSLPLNSPVPSIPPFKTASSHTKPCGNHISASVSTHNTAGSRMQWPNPVSVPNFSPHLLVANDLHSIPPSQLLPPPPLMMNGGANLCQCSACSGTTGYREGVKNTEQVRYLGYITFT